MKKTNVMVSDFRDKSDTELIEIFRSLLNAGIKIDDLLGKVGTRVTIAHVCALCVKPKALFWAVSNSANLNIKSDNGNNALSFLSTNIFNKELDKGKIWEDYRECLNILIDKNVNFNMATYDNKKAIYLLLKYEKSLIPSDIIHIYFDKTRFNDVLDKDNGDNILSSLLFNAKNLTFSNVNYLVKNKIIKLNDHKKSENSLIFLLPYLNKNEVKETKKELNLIFDNYVIDFNVKKNFTDILNEERIITPLEFCINERNNLIFKFLIKKHPKYLMQNCGDNKLVDYCVLTDFIEGVKYLNKIGNVCWEEHSELLSFSKSEKMKNYLQKEHTKYLYFKLNKDLGISNGYMKRIKI